MDGHDLRESGLIDSINDEVPVVATVGRTRDGNDVTRNKEGGTTRVRVGKGRARNATCGEGGDGTGSEVDVPVHHDGETARCSRRTGVGGCKAQIEESILKDDVNLRTGNDVARNSEVPADCGIDTNREGVVCCVDSSLETETIEKQKIV